MRSFCASTTDLPSCERPPDPIEIRLLYVPGTVAGVHACSDGWAWLKRGTHVFKVPAQLVAQANAEAEAVLVQELSPPLVPSHRRQGSNVSTGSSSTFTATGGAPPPRPGSDSEIDAIVVLLSLHALLFLSQVLFLLLRCTVLCMRDNIVHRTIHLRVS